MVLAFEALSLFSFVWWAAHGAAWLCTTSSRWRSRSPWLKGPVGA
jgi:hypothetical protein